MPTRRPEGAALLVAGHGALGAGTFDASIIHTLGQIGEALLATGTSWQIRRLTAAAGDRYAADRGTLKHHVDELVSEQVRVAMLVVLGSVADVGGEPALVTSGQLREYPEDATLPLSWIRDRLVTARAEQVIVAMSARGDAGRVTAWLASLETNRWRPLDLVAVDAAADRAPLIDALLGGLCGDALDPRTGTITLACMSDHLIRAVPGAAVQRSDCAHTFAESPPLAGLWDMRRANLSTRTGFKQAADGSEDLTGTVLPGRFRIDGLVARGTFGSVYRARQLAVERDVACKVLHADIKPSSDDGRLFVQEIRAVGRIDHPNVVRIHQADMTHDGRLFYAMELLTGRDLQQLVNDGPVPRARAVELVRQLVAGLGAAHEAGLVHADIKPANAILTERDGADRVVLVDFGLARLRSNESVGGTPAYMAPEQLHEGRVDARSDLFSAALVLVTLLTGWRRPNAYTLVPKLDDYDADLRAVLGKALAVKPDDRFQTAREFTAALVGGPSTPVSAPIPRVPFRHLSPFTEADRGRLHGREADVNVLVEHVLYRRSVVYTAPSGTGKTSVLRAGLLPRLEALGAHCVYLRCRADSGDALAAAIWPGGSARASASMPMPTFPSGDEATVPASTPAARTAAAVRDANAARIRATPAGGTEVTGRLGVGDAIALHAAQRGGKLVIVLDQLEAALGDDAGNDIVAAALAFDRWPDDADVAVVLSVREDHLARLVARSQHLEPGMPIVRLPPLGIEGARDAITAPLAESRLAIEPELLDALLVDLQTGAAALAPEMGWGTGAVVYPPHLQLACSVLYEALGSGEATLTLAHYRKLGGFDAIVGEHLDRVLDTELEAGTDVIARDLFVALVTAGHERAMRPEAELIDAVGAHDPQLVGEVLEVLRSRGLLVRLRAKSGEPAWELVHDSLVPRVLAWVDRRDLARRRAVELVRYHLRRSRPGAPSLLGRAELREIKSHQEAIEELDAEWKRRGEPLIPSALVRKSRNVLRRRAATIAGVLFVAGTIASASAIVSCQEKKRREYEESLTMRDLGRFTLELAPFDWDPKAQKAIPVAASELPDLAWELHSPDPENPDEPGGGFITEYVVRSSATTGATLVEHVEAHGGPAFLIVTGRGRFNEACPSSVLPIRRLPGYAQRSREPMFHVNVPTCHATRANMIEIPGGPFIYGGQGDPPSTWVLEDPVQAKERRIELATFWIDRTEITNAAFNVFSSMSDFTDIAAPHYYTTTAKLRNSGLPTSPVSGIPWTIAHRYCRFLGKDLPTKQQWLKALRGGETLPDGTRNPMPRRNLPWGPPQIPAPANLKDTEDPGVRPVGSFPNDKSPYGVLDLAGNVMEWTLSPNNDRTVGYRVARGGEFEDADTNNLADFVAIENDRPITTQLFGLGARCADN
jgi:formylglycine-generating enzyme required for sulfatase activity